MELNLDLISVLRRHWGYDSFRPRQEEIVRSLLTGRDACVVMPTGGGKSLCYQLPAAILQDRTVIVVSPLIALMQDQVVQLLQMGISAALLNSSLSPGAQSAVMRKAARGEYRLLYLSPERLAREDTFAWLQKVPVAFFAIDEAHCISEWGHEFRPDYRRLKLLRERFPNLPLAAFTASATRRVRHDILDQLRLRNPHKSIASFYRPNLRYVVQQCPNEREQLEMLLRILRNHAGSNVIVYAPTIARVENTAAELEERGIPSVPYHGRMDPDLRRRNQERWMADEVSVLVGTIAFGLGINKAAVRSVVHLSLPKSVEQYYQEAGRAGRDGHPADCFLLWQPKDAALLAHFINQISDGAERERAWQRYHDIRNFAESSRCRQRQICMHFGETPKWDTCSDCDACSAAPDWLAPAAASSTRRTRRSARSPAATTARDEPAVAEVDPALWDYIREWRQNIAREQKVPAFVVMHDATLEELCRARPASLPELRRVAGIGERKIELYGPALLQAVAAFANGARAVPRAKVSKAAEETLDLLSEGRTLEEIAALRGRRPGSVINLVAEMVERGEVALAGDWVDAQRRAAIEEAATRFGTEFLKPIKDELPPEVSYEEIRLVVAHLRCKKNSQAQG
jgi:ATP-dependent DNA helicase RecQ